MNMIPPPLIPGAASRPALGEASASAASLKWAVLHDAASHVAAAAGLEPEPMTARIRGFPVLLGDAVPWRRGLAERAIDDMAAVMEPGIAALLGIEARGADARPAALALWREFSEARDAVLALVPPAGTMGPPRDA
jgi:hypothetical protein